MIRRILSKVLFSVFGILCAENACNSMLYYPSHKIYNEVIPEKHSEDFLLSESGNVLNYYLFPAEKPKGIILYFHGNARNISAHYKAFLWAVPLGYDLLLFDYSGYGKSTGSPSRRAINADAVSMLKFAADRKKEKGCKLITVGQSIGGAVMLGSLGSFEDVNEIDLILADCTFQSYIKISKAVAGKYCAPLGWFRFAINDDFAPWKSFGAVKDVPVIVSHCREDETVPFYMGEELFGALENKEKLFLEMSCRHTAGYWKESNQKLLMSYFDEMLFGKSKD